MAERGYVTLFCTMPGSESKLTAMPNKEDLILGVPEEIIKEEEKGRKVNIGDILNVLIGL